MIYALWHGGESYSVGGIHPNRDGHSDVETFPSVQAAKDALWSRYEDGYGYRQRFTYADGRTEDTLCPAVTRSSEMFIYFYDPREAGDPYPDRRIFFGPRGGIRSERC